MTIKGLRNYLTQEIVTIRDGWIEVVEDDDEDTHIATCIYSLNIDAAMMQHHYKFVIDLRNKTEIVGDIHYVVPKPRPWVIGAPPITRKEKWLDPDNWGFPMHYSPGPYKPRSFDENISRVLRFIERDMKEKINYQENMAYRHELEKRYGVPVKL